MTSLGKIILYSLIVLIIVSLALIILFLYLAFSTPSYGVLCSNTTPVGQLGKDQLLSCYLTTQSINQVSVSWVKKGLEGPIYQYRNGVANLWGQNSQFRGRTEIFPDALVTGNASLLLRSVTRNDEGEYICSITSYMGEGKVSIYLKTAAISYDVLSANKTPIGFLGEDQLLSCYLTTQNIKQVSVSWVKEGTKACVYQYSNGSANLTYQHSEFRGRTEIFPNALATGNASLLLRNVTRTDEGEYTCNISSSTGHGEANIYLRTAAIPYDVMSTNKTPITILGGDQLLSCYVTTQSFNNVSVTWVKKGVEGFVYQYSNGAVNISNQKSQFRGRTEVFPDVLIRGNASLLLRNVTRTDAGEYTCSFSSFTGEGKVNISLRTAVKTCPSGWTMGQSSCYYFSNSYDSWDKGRDECRKRGADLVIISSTEEQELISKMVKHDIWIGMTDRVTEGDWIWTDGRPLTLAFWQPYQPDNGKGVPLYGEEDCAVLRPRVYFKRNWNDLRCDAHLFWLCEKYPSTLIED